MPWRVFIIIGALLGILSVWMYVEGDLFSERIDVILTRGASDPLGFGWARTVIDTVLRSAPLFGSTTITIADMPVASALLDSGYHNIAAILVGYGWAAFIGVILVYVGFFICVFKMVVKVKQSSFAKYVAMSMAISLAVQAVFSLIGFFLLDGASVDMPFLGGISRNMMNYLCFALILMLYIKRDDPSKIDEIETDPEHKFEFGGFLRKMMDYANVIDVEDEDDIDEDDLIEFLRKEE